MFERPIVVASKCLGFDSCRYNGVTIPDRFVEMLKKHVEFHPVCPEVEIGLGVPRDPIRVVEEEGGKILYQPATKRDVTGKMTEFVRGFLDSLTDVDGFILKNRSPSCGFADVKIYGSTDQKSSNRRGSGFFGGAVIDRYGTVTVEDEGRLKNFTIREHFLTSLFMLASFRHLQKNPMMGGLVEFHTRNKLLLMGYSQSRMRELGRVVSNHEKRDLRDAFSLYLAKLRQALEKPPRYTSMINVLLHAFGGLSQSLKSEEKRFFLNTLEEYRDERVPLSVPLHLLEGWSISHDNRYLLNQSFLEPFPRDLVAVTDSGKGRDQR